MVEIAADRRWEKTKHSHNKDTKYGMYRYRTRFGFPVKNHAGGTVGSHIYTAKITIRNSSDGRKYLYDIVSIKKDTASSDWLTKRITRSAQYSAAQKGNVFVTKYHNQNQIVSTLSVTSLHQIPSAPTWAKSSMKSNLRRWAQMVLYLT